MLSTLEIESYLSGKGQWRRNGSEWIGVCPDCRGGKANERSLSVNTDNGQWICNRKNNCGKSGGFKALQELYGDAPKFRASLLEIQAKAYSQPKPKAKALKENGRQFLNGRGLNDLTIDAWRVGQERQWFRKLNGEGDGICWPVYDAAGNLANVKSRALDVKDFANQKGCAQWPVGLHLVSKDIHGPVLTFTEGELDAMSAFQLGRGNVVSLPNGAGDQTWIELAWEWLEGFRELYFCLDADKAGREALDRIIARLGYGWRIFVVTLPGVKDANEGLQSGMTSSQLAEAFATARELTPDTVKAADHYTDAVWERLANRHRMTGFTSGFYGVDQITHGFRGGEVSVWTGQSGSGKSTVLGMIAVNSLAGGIKTCVSSLEIPPENYLAWMVLQASGRKQPTRDESNQVMKWLGTGLLMVQRVTSSALDDMLSDWAYCAQRHGCRQFIVDPMQCVEAGSDEYAAQAKVINAMLRFARQYRVHVHMVAHPKKQDTDNAELGQNAIKGNKAVTDLAHNIFAVARVPNLERTAISVIKCREYGVPAKPVTLVTVDADCKQVFDRDGAPNFWPFIDDVDIPEWKD